MDNRMGKRSIWCGVVRPGVGWKRCNWWRTWWILTWWQVIIGDWQELWWVEVHVAGAVAGCVEVLWLGGVGDGMWLLPASYLKFQVDATILVTHIGIILGQHLQHSLGIQVTVDQPEMLKQGKRNLNALWLITIFKKCQYCSHMQHLISI